MNGGLTIVGHETDEARVPLVDDTRKGGGARGHEHLTNAVLELFDRVIVDAQEGLCRALLGVLVLEIPDAVLVLELLVEHAHLGQDAHLEAAHGEEQIGVVAAVDRRERVLPLERRDRARQRVLELPEDGAAEVDVVLHEAHARVARPALFVVVADDVLVVGVGVLGEVALDQLLGLLGREAVQHKDAVDVARVESYRMAHLGGERAEREKVVRQIRRAGDLGGARQAQQQNVEHQAVVLHDERRELQAANEAVRVGVVHVLVVDDDVVLGRHVVGNVVVENETQQAVEEREVHLVVQLLEAALEHHDALAVRGLPHLVEVVDALAPLVHEQRRRLRVGRLDPVRKQVALVGLVPEILVEVGVGDLFERLNVVHRNQVRVHVHELDRHLLEGALRQEMALDARQAVVRPVVRRLDQAQLLALRLVQAALDAVRLLEPLERQNQQLGVVLVRQRRERNRRELAALEPMHRRRVDGDRLLARQIRAVLEVVVLSLLLGLEVQARQSTEVLLAHGLVDRRAASDALAVVVRHVGPPVGLLLDVAQNHVLDLHRQARHVPDRVRLEAPPRLAQVLQNRARLVGLDALGHHVDNVVHDRRSELEIKVTLDSLLGHRLGDALRRTTFELSSKQVTEPAFKQRHDTAHKEQPNSPTWCPEATTRSFTNWSSIESIID